MVNGKQIELRDGDALDILADRWRKANGGYGNNDGEINGGDLVELVGGLLKETGRPLVFTPATRSNMQTYLDRHADEEHAPKAVCVSVYGGPEEYSASPGDYLGEEDDEPLKDEDGEPMILAVKSEAHGLRDALTGAPIHVEHP